MEVIIKFEAAGARVYVAAGDDEKDNFRDDDFVLKWSRRYTALFNYLTANLLMHRSRAPRGARAGRRENSDEHNFRYYVITDSLQ